MGIKKKLLIISSSIMLIASAPVIFLTYVLPGYAGPISPEYFYNDFSLSSIDSDSVFSPSTWNKKWINAMEEDGYSFPEDPLLTVPLEFNTVSKSHDKFSNEFVENIFSDKKNMEYGGGPGVNENIRAHHSVSLVSDTDSTLMSLVSRDGLLKDLEHFNISEVNTDINPKLVKVAIDNSSREVNGIREQIGIPYSFRFQGMKIEPKAMLFFNENYELGGFDHLSISGTEMSNIIKSTSNQYSDLSEYINKHGWTWNEMMGFGNTLIKLMDDDIWSYRLHHFLDNRIGMGLEGFLFADRFDQNKNPIWKGISDDWNSDILETLASLNNSSNNEVSETISKVIELLAPISDPLSGEYSFTDAIFSVSNLYAHPSYNDWDVLLPMPLYTNEGNDIYDDLVINTNSLYLIDEDNFYSSDTGVAFREKVLELLMYRTYKGDDIEDDFFNYISPYISTEKINSSSYWNNEYLDKLSSIVLSTDENYSVSSQRWAGTWFRDTLENSIQWNDEPLAIDREYVFEFKPTTSLQREVDLYNRYNLNMK